MGLESRIEAVLEESVRPMLKCHGGDVRLAGHRDGVVTVELRGACSGCPSADLSTKGFIEDVLRTALPEVRRVELLQTVSPELLDLARRLLGGEVLP